MTNMRSAHACAVQTRFLPCRSDAVSDIMRPRRPCKIDTQHTQYKRCSRLRPGPQNEAPEHQNEAPERPKLTQNSTFGPSKCKGLVPQATDAPPQPKNYRNSSKIVEKYDWKRIKLHNIIQRNVYSFWDGNSYLCNPLYYMMIRRRSNKSIYIYIYI